MKALSLSLLLLCGCTSLEKKAIARAEEVKHWQQLVDEKKITYADYDNFIKTRGELVSTEPKP